MVGFSQNCELTLTGSIKDIGTNEPIPYATLFINETETGTETDADGHFELSKLCKGHYHITLSHIGCESKKVFIELNESTTDVNLTMKHSIHDLHDVVLTGKSAPPTTQIAETLTEQHISDNANQSLATMVEAIAGVSTIKNGSGIAKPVVHGLWGNRINILNNGVPQSGQQWGADHSPEIDPLVANKITVVKGTASLEYMGTNLGASILVEPEKIEKEPHLHGKANYYFESNGLSNGVNAQLQQYTKKIGWKVNGTFKKSADKRTPDYFLTNTGTQEINFALQLEKEFSDKWHTDFYFSTFNTELGILEGTQIGNTTDLKKAFTEKEPQFTKNEASFDINPPKQQVNHHLVKLHSKYFIDFSQWLDVTVSAQLNNREEFDKRRGGRSNLPVQSLDQFSLFFETKYLNKISPSLTLKTGVQFNYINNQNDPITSTLPLIPDYISFKSSAYTVLSKKQGKSFFELGARYDNNIQNVASVINRRVERFKNEFHNFSTSGGWVYTATDHISLSYNLGYATRNPAINELYSFGLHQGVAGIEQGNNNLKTEKALKTTLGIKGDVHEKFSFEALAYFQKFDNYIFIQPRGELRLTIRGAFPLFDYKQTDAQIYGLDVLTNYNISPSFKLQAGLSYIIGEDTTKNEALVFIPTTNFSGGLSYEFPKPISIGKKQFENFKLALRNKYITQSRTTAEQDRISPEITVTPPDAYNLLDFTTSTDIQLNKTRLRITGKVTNILNATYRDYLNRQRYFADDLGINASIGLQLTF
ncbi:TonB-dependent receptor [Aquimarina agarilytica]|uniref:TonB-dependent receptor n=1 Tax=Aquimarina agarilytica TaxID=1087449 RepID=UPI001E5FA57D|nr:TonB-dependent receptor [Aquimarina agarilytica]